jgi:hypothetical protein
MEQTGSDLDEHGAGRIHDSTAAIQVCSALGT